MTTFTGIVYYKDGKEVKKMSSEENKTIIKALNMYGRVPEMWELLEEIERLNNIINELEKFCNDEIKDYDKHIKSQYATDIAREQYKGEKTCFEDMLYKLQELKESNKE